MGSALGPDVLRCARDAEIHQNGVVEISRTQVIIEIHARSGRTGRARQASLVRSTRSLRFDLQSALPDEVLSYTAQDAGVSLRSGTSAL